MSTQPKGQSQAKLLINGWKCRGETPKFSGPSAPTLAADRYGFLCKAIHLAKRKSTHDMRRALALINANDRGSTSRSRPVTACDSWRDALLRRVDRTICRQGAKSRSPSIRCCPFRSPQAECCPRRRRNIGAASSAGEIVELRSHTLGGRIPKSIGRTDKPPCRPRAGLLYTNSLRSSPICLWEIAVRASASRVWRFASERVEARAQRG